MKPVERKINPETKDEEGIASQIFGGNNNFENTDFGYFKVTIERPKRLKAQFSKERIAELRFDKALKEPMAWAYEQFGEEVYSNLAKHEKTILDWVEKMELNLNAKQSKALISPATWQKQLDLLETGHSLMKVVGTKLYSDFNVFRDEVEEALRGKGIKLSSSEKNALLNAVSW